MAAEARPSAAGSTWKSVTWSDSPEQRIVPETVVLGGQAERRRSRCRLGQSLPGQLAQYRSQSDEARHACTEALRVVVLRHLPERLPDILGIGQDLQDGWLVSHQSRHVVRMQRDEGEPGHRATAGTKQIDRPSSDRLDHPVHVLGVDLRRVLSFGHHAPPDTVGS